MHTRFFTHCHNMLQFVIFSKPQRDGDLIQPILRQDHDQIFDPSDHFNPFIHRPSGNLII